MRIPGPSRWLRSRLARVSSSISMSSSQLRASRPSWWALVDWSVRTPPVGHDPTVQQPAARSRSGSPAEEYSGHRPLRFWVGSIGGVTPSPSASRTGARPDIVGHPRWSTATGVPGPAPAEHTATGEDRPYEAPAARVRVVLLPHTQAEPTDTRTNNRHTGKVTRMNQRDSSRCHPTQSDGRTVA
jgi:hypothetical protein